MKDGVSQEVNFLGVKLQEMRKPEANEDVVDIALRNFQNMSVRRSYETSEQRVELRALPHSANLLRFSPSFNSLFMSG